ncbi:MAG: Hsp20/alpha crystallin family protein [Bacteroidota bacterium]
MSILMKSHGGIFLLGDGLAYSQTPYSALRHNGSRVPANVTETSRDFLVELATPGLKRKDFKVEISNHILRIRSEAKEEKNRKTVRYIKREFTYSSFNRSFTLPDNVKESDVDAKYEGGILKVIIPKKEITVTKLSREIVVA